MFFHRMKKIPFGSQNDSPEPLWSKRMARHIPVTKRNNLTLMALIAMNWTYEFEQMLRELRVAIVQINSTRLDLSFMEGLSSWISSAVSYFKEWVGVGLFGAVLCCGIVFILWLVCKLRTQNKRDKVVIAQALAALEQGASTDIWLTMLKQ